MFSSRRVQIPEPRWPFVQFGASTFRAFSQSVGAGSAPQYGALSEAPCSGAGPSQVGVLRLRTSHAHRLNSPWLFSQNGASNYSSFSQSVVASPARQVGALSQAPCSGAGALRFAALRAVGLSSTVRRPNPSIERTRNGRPRYTALLFSVPRGLPSQAAHGKR